MVLRFVGEEVEIGLDMFSVKGWFIWVNGWFYDLEGEMIPEGSHPLAPDQNPGFWDTTIIHDPGGIGFILHIIRIPMIKRSWLKGCDPSGIVFMMYHDCVPMIKRSWVTGFDPSGIGDYCCIPKPHDQKIMG